jgi:hypothetical protein
MKALQETDLKTHINKLSREVSLSSEQITEEFVRTCKVLSLEYKQRMLLQIQKGIVKVKKSGAIPYSYKQMGVSPRIIPISYGNSFNSVKRVVRDAYYDSLGQSLRQEGMCILDLDLVSCYTSILLGIYPAELRSIQNAIETRGLWETIKNEFEKKGKGHVFNKPAVKICVYSSFFLGGYRAMMNGILDYFRKDLGLTNKQFISCSYYEECYKVAQDVTQEMMDSTIITDFRDISNYIFRGNVDEYLHGPTGHFYLVTEVDFKSAYPNYLQSYEFALLAQTSLEVMSEFPRVQLIGHFHDGNVWVVPIEEREAFVSSFGRILAQIGSDIGLRYKQKIEVKRIYK